MLDPEAAVEEALRQAEDSLLWLRRSFRKRQGGRKGARNQTNPKPITAKEVLRRETLIGHAIDRVVRALDLADDHRYQAHDVALDHLVTIISASGNMRNDNTTKIDRGVKLRRKSRRNLRTACRKVKQTKPERERAASLQERAWEQFDELCHLVDEVGTTINWTRAPASPTARRPSPRTKS
jgi:hypothetical protein